MIEPTPDLRVVSTATEADSGEPTTPAPNGIYGRYLAATEEAERAMGEIQGLYREMRGVSGRILAIRLTELPLSVSSTVNRDPRVLNVPIWKDVGNTKQVAANREDFVERRDGTLTDQNGKEIKAGVVNTGQRYIAVDPGQQDLVRDVGTSDVWIQVQDPVNPELQVRYDDSRSNIYVIEGDGENAVFFHWGINGFGQFGIDVETLGAPKAVTKGNVFDVVKRVLDFTRTAELRPADSAPQVPTSTPESISLPTYPEPVPTPVTAPIGS